MYPINLTSTSCGLDTSTGTAQTSIPKLLVEITLESTTFFSWFPQCQNIMNINTVNMIPTFRCLTHNRRQIPRGGNSLIQDQKGCFLLSRQNITIMFYHLAFFPDPCSLFPATPFPNSQLAMASAACPFASKITPQPLQRMWLCFKIETKEKKQILEQGYSLLLTIPCSSLMSSAKDLALENLDFGQGSALEHSLLLSTLWHRKPKLCFLLHLFPTVSWPWLQVRAPFQAKSLPNHYGGCDYALKKNKKRGTNLRTRA